MTAPVVPRLRVEPPTPAPEARYNLFTAATVLENVEPHALMGVTYDTVCTTQVDGYPADCEPGAEATLPRQKTPADTTSVTTGTPFGVYAADSCVLGRDETEAREQLRQRFTTGEAAAVENIVATGVAANWPNLTNPTVIPSGTAPDTLAGAVGLLEQWLAETTGTAGVIHAPRTVGPAAFQQMQAETSGPRAMTRMGSAWVFGTGYTGTAPPGTTDDGTLWLYATPTVTVRRSRLIEPADWSTGAFNRETNQALLVTERLYVVDWPCSAAAVKTAITRPGYVAPTTTTV